MLPGHHSHVLTVGCPYFSVCWTESTESLGLASVSKQVKGYDNFTFMELSAQLSLLSAFLGVCGVQEIGTLRLLLSRNSLYHRPEEFPLPSASCFRPVFRGASCHAWEASLEGLGSVSISFNWYLIHFLPLSPPLPGNNTGISL